MGSLTYHNKHKLKYYFTLQQVCENIRTGIEKIRVLGPYGKDHLVLITTSVYAFRFDRERFEELRMGKKTKIFRLDLARLDLLKASDLFAANQADLDFSATPETREENLYFVFQAKPKDDDEEDDEAPPKATYLGLLNRTICCARLNETS